MSSRLLITDGENLIAAIPMEQTETVGNCQRFAITAASLEHAKQAPTTFEADHVSFLQTKLKHLHDKH